MLKEFYVDNYKSLINITFRPGPENLLLGMNNAGKTNLCQAMQFLSATVHQTLDDCADRVAGMRVALTNHYLKKSTIDFRVKAVLPWESEELSFQYDVSLDVVASSGSVPTLRVLKEVLHVNGPGFEDAILLENVGGRVQLLHEKKHLEGESGLVETTCPVETTMLCRLYHLETNERSNLFKEYLRSWEYYALSAKMLRNPGHTPNLMVLNPDGSNLSSVVYQLKTSNEHAYRRLLPHLQQMEPTADAVNFSVPPDNQNVFMYFQDTKDNRLPAINASSGTLRFLALSYILTASPPRPFSPLVMIEEPENGIYVDLLRELMTMGPEDSHQPQLIFTTHSPYFIDLFDERLDHVFMMKRGDEHSTLTQPDPEAVRKRLEEYSLGEQHFREMLA